MSTLNVKTTLLLITRSCSWS